MGWRPAAESRAGGIAELRILDHVLVIKSMKNGGYLHDGLENLHSTRCEQRLIRWLLSEGSVEALSMQIAPPSVFINSCRRCYFFVLNAGILAVSPADVM